MMRSLQALRRWFDYQLLWRDPPIIPFMVFGGCLASLLVTIVFACGFVDSSLQLKDDQVSNLESRVLGQFAANYSAMPDDFPEAILGAAARATGDAAVVLVDSPKAQLPSWSAAFDADLNSQTAANKIARTRLCRMDEWDMDLRPALRALVVADFTGKCSLVQRLEARSFLLWRTGPVGWFIVALLVALACYIGFKAIAAFRVKRAFRWLYRSSVVGGGDK